MIMFFPLLLTLLRPKLLSVKTGERQASTRGPLERGLGFDSDELEVFLRQSNYVYVLLQLGFVSGRRRRLGAGSFKLNRR